MRTRLSAAKVLTTAALAICAPLLLAAGAGAQQATPESSAAVNQASPVTEKILKELRASQAEPDTAASTPVADPASAGSAAPLPVAPAPDTAAMPGPVQDGSLAAPVAETSNTDGQLATPQETAPVDGDMAGDGKLVATPAEASKDPLAEEPPAIAPSRIRLRPTAALRRDARSVAGRSRIVAEADPAPRRIRPEAAPSDAAVPDVANGDSDGDASPPALRPQTAAEDDEDPYAPVGYKIGSFKLMPSITAETVFSDNVRQSQSNRQADMALVLRPAFTLESDWSRHFVSVDLRGMTAKNMRLGDENNRDVNLDITGRYDIREGTSLDGQAAYELGRIPHSDPSLPSGATMRPSTATATLGAAINHKINRLALRLHGAVADTDQGDSGSGPVKFRDGTVDTRAAYELSPSLTVFGTAKRVGRRFTDGNGVDGVANEARIVLETDSSAKLSAIFNVGLARVTSANPAADSAGGLVGGANVIWLPSALTTLTFAASSDLDVTEESGATALRTTKLGVDLKHGFRRWLTMLVGYAETRRYFAGIDLAQTERTGHLGFEYDLNRTVALTGDVKRTTLASTDASKAYTEDQVLVGVKLQK